MDVEIWIIWIVLGIVAVLLILTLVWCCIRLKQQSRKCQGYWDDALEAPEMRGLSDLENPSITESAEDLELPGPIQRSTEVWSLTNITNRNLPLELQNSRRSYIASFHKGYKTFHGTRVYGRGAVLQAPDSDVKLLTPEGTEAFIYGHAHTSVQHFLPHIPEDECLVAPIVDYQCAYQILPDMKRKFKIIIPHCVKDRDTLASIRVQHGDIYKNKPFREISSSEVDDSYITIYTNEFSQFICTSCQSICHGQGKAFVFGNLIKYPSLPPLSSVRLYMCSPLYNIKEYRKYILDIEQHHKRSKVEEVDLKWNPEEVSSSENVLINVQVQDGAFKPRQPIPAGQEWVEQSNTLVQKNPKEDMYDMFFCHLCKAEPSIVATFYFEQIGEVTSGCSVFSGSMGMCTDSNVFLLQTFFAIKSVELLTEELSRQQQTLTEITRELITTDDELNRFALHLGFTYEMIQQTRTNHPHSVEGAALHLACLWWEDGMTTNEEKVPILLDAVRAIGKCRLINWVKDKLSGGIDYRDNDSVMVGGIVEHSKRAPGMAGGIETPQEASGVTGSIERPQSPSVVVAGTEHPEMEGVMELPGVSAVMVVDEIEERSNVVVPIRERFVGIANPTDD